MDVLSALLAGPRASGAFLVRSIMEPPWSMRIEDEAPLTVVTVVQGRAIVLDHTGDPHRLAVGDVALVRGPAPYTVADDAATVPQVVVHPDQRCTMLDGSDAWQQMVLGVRTWCNDPHGSTVLLTGTYQTAGEVSRRVLDALPAVAVVPCAPAGATLVDLLGSEMGRDAPGQEVVLDRLLDLVLLDTLRQWFTRAEVPPAWYRAQADPVIGRALQLIHHDPSRAWTVAELAAEVALSRAALARRFHDLVGEPPLTYVTNWRMALAADLLGVPGATVASVSSRVGYASPFTFSTAFKRVYGVSPRAHRDRAVTAARAGIDEPHAGVRR